MKDPELQAAFEEVRRRTGRNLLLFQEAEYFIKGLLAMGSFRLTQSEGPKSIADRVQEMKKETMGGLKNRLFENHIHDGTEPWPDLPDNSDPSGPCICTTFAIGVADLAESQAAVDRMVVERNELVHHLYPKLAPLSLESCNTVALWLDRQREEVLPTVEWLQEQLRMTHKQLVEMIQFMNSEDGREVLRTSDLQQSPAISKLASVAKATMDPEGWISVRDAYRLLDEDEQDEIARLRKYYSLASLSSIIVASRLFEIKMAPADQGPGKAFFRLIPDTAESRPGPPSA